VEFTHEVTDEQALFWANADELTGLLNSVAAGDQEPVLKEFSARGRERVSAVYQWDAVTDQYEALIHRLAATRKR
jgi:glycosyltransferase involved in cell wall biosynthesis